MKPCLFLGAAVSLAATLPSPDATAAVTESVLYSFGAAPDGQAPVGALVLDKRGNLYGATSSGGLYGYGVASASGRRATARVRDAQNTLNIVADRVTMTRRAA